MELRYNYNRIFREDREPEIELICLINHMRHEINRVIKHPNHRGQALLTRWGFTIVDKIELGISIK